MSLTRAATWRSRAHRRTADRWHVPRVGERCPHHLRDRIYFQKELPVRVIVEVPERVFLAAKTPQQAAEDVRRAAAAYWIASGDLTPEAANEITTPGATTAGPTLLELLLRMPDVGDDADFERPREL